MSSANRPPPFLIPGPPPGGFKDPHSRALYCIANLNNLLKFFKRALDRLDALHLLSPNPIQPPRRTVQWITTAQLRVWNTTKAMLIACGAKEREDPSFAQALGRAEAMQLRLRWLILCDVKKPKGDGPLYLMDDPEITNGEALCAFREPDSEDSAWLETAAVAQVRDEYRHRLRLMREKWERERTEHVKTKRKMLQGEIRCMELLAEKYREIAEMRRKYEYDDLETDGQEQGVQRASLPMTVDSGLGITGPGVGEKRKRSPENWDVDALTNIPSDDPCLPSMTDSEDAL